MTHDEIEGTLILEMHINIQLFLLYISFIFPQPL
jgi:hypothetical protein